MSDKGQNKRRKGCFILTLLQSVWIWLLHEVTAHSDLLSCKADQAASYHHLNDVQAYLCLWSNKLTVTSWEPVVRSAYTWGIRNEVISFWLHWWKMLFEVIFRLFRLNLHNELYPRTFELACNVIKAVAPFLTVIMSCVISCPRRLADILLIRRWWRSTAGLINVCKRYLQTSLFNILSVKY